MATQSSLSAILGNVPTLAGDSSDLDRFVDRLLAFAEALATGTPVSGGELNTCEFSLPVLVLTSFVDRLYSATYIDHQKLRLEYDLELGVARFKMPESGLHSCLGGNIGEIIYNAAYPVLDLDYPLKLKKIFNSAITLPDAMVQKQPDSSCGIYNQVLTHIAYPRVIIEVALSHPSTLAGLTERLRQLLLRTDGEISAAVGIKLFYDPKQSQTAILDNLHQCFVGV
ncbi:hypothetical protein CSAL01_13691 [Colletotrichum salicis]|uniref:Uncharacterized protein n=1 Tax=Colletotrichum salicis TaxID=1209931 RepID=A0A135SV32_9PEZI|nr:hypothetical protein CSAL01_13691 [Colletotrichum salicis]